MQLNYRLNALIERLRDDLASAGYSVDALDALWGVDAAAALHRGNRLPARRALARLEGGGRLGALAEPGPHLLTVSLGDVTSRPVALKILEELAPGAQDSSSSAAPSSATPSSATPSSSGSASPSGSASDPASASPPPASASPSAAPATTTDPSPSPSR